METDSRMENPNSCYDGTNCLFFFWFLSVSDCNFLCVSTISVPVLCYTKKINGLSFDLFSISLHFHIFSHREKINASKNKKTDKWKGRETKIKYI